MSTPAPITAPCPGPRNWRETVDDRLRWAAVAAAESGYGRSPRDVLEAVAYLAADPARPVSRDMIVERCGLRPRTVTRHLATLLADGHIARVWGSARCPGYSLGAVVKMPNAKPAEGAEPDPEPAPEPVAPSLPLTGGEGMTLVVAKPSRKPRSTPAPSEADVACARECLEYRRSGCLHPMPAVDVEEMLPSVADKVRLMRERDRREHRHILRLFRWGCDHHFWGAKGNLVSPAKFRRRDDDGVSYWVRLVTDMRAEQAPAAAPLTEREAAKRWRDRPPEADLDLDWAGGPP